MLSVPYEVGSMFSAQFVLTCLKSAVAKFTNLQLMCVWDMICFEKPVLKGLVLTMNM